MKNIKNVKLTVHRCGFNRRYCIGVSYNKGTASCWKRLFDIFCPFGFIYYAKPYVTGFGELILRERKFF